MPVQKVRRFTQQRPWLVSLFLISLLTIWLSLGTLKAEETSSNNATQSVIPLAKVEFQTFQSQTTSRTIDLYGRTAPNRQARLGAELAGKVVSLKIDKGDTVKKGQVIALIDKQDLQIQLERAKAQLRVRQKEFKAAQQLKSRGLQGEVAYESASAALVEAKASVSNAQTALNNTKITAPFSGVVDHLFVELGDFVGIGDPVANVLDLNRLVIEADVSERHIQYLQSNQKAKVRLINGDQVTGTLRYVSKISSESTNTFPIEVEISNEKGQVPAGMSAELQLSLATTQAVKVTPAMLALDEDGNLGVKTLQQEHVKFVPIQLVKAEQDGVWLSGLGESVNIITLGQGFVRDGDQVEATPASNAQ